MTQPWSPGDFVDVVIRWNFKVGCEALVVVARKGQVHCKAQPAVRWRAGCHVRLGLMVKESSIDGQLMSDDGYLMV